MATNTEWLRRGNTYFASYRGRVAKVQKADGQHFARIYNSDGKQLAVLSRPTHSGAKAAALTAIDELADQPSPESTPKATTRAKKFERGQAVVLRKGRKHTRQLLAIIADFSVVPEGLPGPHRYRYMLTPARIHNGVPVAIECFAWVRGVKGDQLEAYDEATHGGNLAKWRVT